MVTVLIKKYFIKVVSLKLEKVQGVDKNSVKKLFTLWLMRKSEVRVSKKLSTLWLMSKSEVKASLPIAKTQ